MTRHYFTDEESDKLGPLVDQFCRQLAFATASVLNEFPEDVRDAVLMTLQDATSLYSPYTADLRDGFVNVMHREGDQ